MSKQFLKQCLKSIHVIFKMQHRLSFQTKRDYSLGMAQIARELHAGGYPLSNIKDIKPKHVNYLVEYWQKKELNNGTIKNRLSQIRFLAEQIKKPDLLPKSNNDLNVAKRSYIATTSKAIRDVDPARFQNIFIQYSVRLQEAFGLRREEAIKFIVSYADQGSYIQLKDSWTKGGIARAIPLVNPEQRELLDEIKSIIGRGRSLIPEDKNYAYQRKAYDAAVSAAGYKNLHGLRHAYAQRRYHELTEQLSSNGKGWHAPFNGGPHRKELTMEQKTIDDEARLIISRELGHSRKQISRLYLS